MEYFFFLSVVLSAISYANYSVLFLSNSASLRQEDCCELKATPDYITSIKPAWRGCLVNLCLKKQNKQQQQGKAKHKNP